ncbi:MAG: sugar ABC transporter substrate-binding protein [Cellulosilyticaceae bacterium]
MNKKFLVGMLASVMAVSTIFTGCSAGKDEAKATPEAGTEAGVKTIKVWGMGEEGKLLPKMVEKFEAENPNIKVEVQALPWDQAHDKLLTAVASQNGPDIIQMGTSWIPEFAEAGALLDLKPYVDEYPNLKQENYFDSSLQTASYNDEYVGVPWYVDTRVLYYRTDLLAEVGYPKGPNNWDELKDASKKLAARGEGLYGLDLNPKDQFFAITYGWQNGSDVIKDGVPQFNTPKFTEAVEYLKSFFEEGLSPKQDDMDIVQAFKEGIKPMYISGPWMVNIMNDQAPEIKDKWAVRTLPAKETNTSFVGGANFTVFHNSKNVPEALKFISYMNSPETQLEWLEVSNTLPSRKEAWEQDKLKNDPILKVFGEQMLNAKTAPFLPQWEAIAQEVNSTFEKINLAGADVKTELEALNKKAEELLAN